jgi:signal recognition particle subunit SRP54
LDSLGQSLRDVVKRIANAPHIDKDLIKEVVKEIQRALIRGDVNVKLVLEMTKDLEKRALTEKPPAGMSNREHVIKIIYEEIIKILGRPRDLAIKPQTILMVGLYGQGKTTCIGKLAKFFQKRGLNVGLIAGDVHRPAAYDQLKQLADTINVPVYGSSKEKKAPKVVREGMEHFREFDVIIVDSSGRHSLEKELIEEIKRVAKVAKPNETLLVLDSAVGQQAGPQAKAFHEAVGVTGVIITKLDGTAKGGGALSAVSETDAPIVFIGTGEHIDDLEKFDPPRFISRMLGMGDLKTLLEKAEEVMDEEEAAETAKKIMSGKFTLREMYKQMEALSKMGPLSKVFSMLPMGGKMSDDDIEDAKEKLELFRYIMDSMTEQELENPKIIKHARIERIARGSGTTISDVRQLLKQYNTSKKAIKGMMGNRKMRRQLMKQMGSGDFNI